MVVGRVEKERSGSLASGTIVTCCLQGETRAVLTCLIFSQRILKNVDHSWNEAPQRCSWMERIGRKMSSRGERAERWTQKPCLGQNRTKIGSGADKKGHSQAEAVAHW